MGAAQLGRWGELGVNVWLAIPYGALAGALAGALSLGLSIGVRTLLGMRTGMIIMLEEWAYLNSAPAITQFMDGFRGGVAFGVSGGLLPGMIGSLALSIWRRWRELRSASA